MAAALYGFYGWIVWLINLFTNLLIRQNTPFFYACNQGPEPEITLTDEAQPCFFRSHKKPQWVVDKVIYLKAVNPFLGCRKIAELFDRIHAAKHNMTVSKSYVYDVLKKHRYEIQLLRRVIKHRRPKHLKKNICWGLDLTTVTDSEGRILTIFAIVDYGSRRCVCLQQINNKSSLMLLFYLFQTITCCGKPKAVKTDNEAVFTSFLFRCSLAIAGIKHQRTNIASPWQNGRVERLIGTFKEKIRQVIIQDQKQLNLLLPQFQFWYNCVRPHSYLDGRTPMEVWNKVDVFQYGYKRAIRYDKWGGLLTGYYLVT